MRWVRAGRSQQISSPGLIRRLEARRTATRSSLARKLATASAALVQNFFKGFQAGRARIQLGGASNSYEAALEADWALNPLVIARLLLIELLLRKLFGAGAVIAVIVRLAITGAITVTGEGQHSAFHQ